jgi:hypothetical protein
VPKLYRIIHPKQIKCDSLDLTPLIPLSVHREGKTMAILYQGVILSVHSELVEGYSWFIVAVMVRSRLVGISFRITELNT